MSQSWLRKKCGRVEEDVRGIEEIGGAEVSTMEIRDRGNNECKEKSLREICKAVKMWLFRTWNSVSGRWTTITPSLFSMTLAVTY